MDGSFDFPLDRVGVVRSGGGARLAFAVGDDSLGCYRAALLCSFCCGMAGLLCLLVDEWGIVRAGWNWMRKYGEPLKKGLRF